MRFRSDESPAGDWGAANAPREAAAGAMGAEAGEEERAAVGSLLSGSVEGVWGWAAEKGAGGRPPAPRERKPWFRVWSEKRAGRKARECCALADSGPGLRARWWLIGPAGEGIEGGPPIWKGRLVTTGLMAKLDYRRRNAEASHASGQALLLLKAKLGKNGTAEHQEGTICPPQNLQYRSLTCVGRKAWRPRANTRSSCPSFLAPIRPRSSGPSLSRVSLLAFRADDQARRDRCHGLLYPSSSPTAG